MSESFTATINGIELAYRLDGARSRPALVLVNSLGTTMDVWAPQLGSLASEFFVVRFDLRGHGQTGAPGGPYRIEDLADDLVGLIDHLGVERAAICGLSIGGMIAMSVAARAPGRVGSLVLACTAAQFSPPAAWDERAAHVRAKGVASLTDGLFARWFTEPMRREQPELLARVAAMLASCDPEGYAGCCEAIAGADLTASLGAIEAPTLVIAGSEDPVSTPETGLRLAQAIPVADFSVLSGAAHLANLAHPDRFADLVATHLRGGARERGMAVRRAVLGDAHVDRALAAAEGFGGAFQEFITAYAWGAVWGRPGLDRRTRSAITLAMLSALGRHEELSFHVPAALRNGLRGEEIEEVLVHSAVYGGVPAANRAVAVAREALARIEP
ncbi:MAG: 3-oxoadipate enol-lactonase [Actinomycetota bacterium]|nr:3-oxoadipate enol-lactonase [Actinomycetota bacterium]